MSRLAGLSGPDDRGYRPSGRPAVPGAATAGAGPRRSQERAEQVHGQREDDGGVLVGAELARPSDESSDPVQRCSDEIAYHLMTDAGFRLSLTHRALHGRTPFIPRAASPQLIAHLTERCARHFSPNRKRPA